MLKHKYNTILVYPSLPMPFIISQINLFKNTKSILITTPSLLPRIIYII